MWYHNKNEITFTLVVDNFGIKYKRKEDAMHLIHALLGKYEIRKNWTGSLYSGITLNCYHKAGILDIFIPGYVKGRSPQVSAPHSKLTPALPTPM